MTKTYAHATNEELVAACLAGDHQAWEAMLERYGRLLYSLAIKAGLGPEDAADVFQIVCVILLERLHTLREPGKLHGWLVTTAKRECWRLRRLRNTPDLALQELPGQGQNLGPVAGQGVGPDDQLLLLERQNKVRAGLKTLGARCQKLLWSLYYTTTPLSHEEIARQLQVAVGSVGRLRARCLERLRSALSSFDF